MIPGTARAEAFSPTSIIILGGVTNLDGYCQSIGDVKVSLDGSTAYDWHCVTPNGSHVALSMTSACQWQYSESDALDRMANFYDPYSWQCWGSAS